MLRSFIGNRSQSYILHFGTRRPLTREPILFSGTANSTAPAVYLLLQDATSTVTSRSGNPVSFSQISQWRAASARS